MPGMMWALAAAGVLAGQAPRDGARPLAPSFLKPGAFQVEAGRAFALEVQPAEAGPASDNARVAWVFTRVAGTQRNWDAAPLDGEGRARVLLDEAGVGVVGVDLVPRGERVEAGELRRLVAERGLLREGTPVPEAGAVRVWRVESLKAIVRSGRPGEEAGPSVATSKAGQASEIRPLMDPLGLTLPSDVSVRAYAGSGAAGGARLVARHVGSGREQTVRLDPSGIGNFRLDAAGEWRLEVHVLADAGEGKGLVLYSATLAFEVPAPGGAER